MNKSILSVITHRQFASVVRSAGYGNSEKMTDLLSRLGMGNRLLTDLTNMKSKISVHIDYNQVDKNISHERDRTYGYLRNYIS